jgi:error-prone DNA polymerase
VVPRFEEATHHRVLTHSSGFQMSPYADVKPPGEAVSSGGLGRSLVPRSTRSPAEDVGRRLWHRSPGSPG